MAFYFHVLLFKAIALAFIVREASTTCSDHCVRYDGEGSPCVTVDCKRNGLQTTCQISITDDNAKADLTPRCIEPSLVPGFPALCTNILKNTTAVPGPASIEKDLTPTTPEDHRTTTTSVNECHCFGTTVLASVAVGCFVSGCFLTGLITCLYRFCKKTGKKIEQEEVQSFHSNRWLPMGRGREMGSTSSAQLLANGSVDTNSTHNTLLSTNEGHTTSHSNIFLEARPDRAQALNNSISSSLPWLDVGYPPGHRQTNHQRNPTAHWVYAKGNHIGAASTLPRNWNERDLPPSSQARTLPTPCMETIYSPASESSSRDYQSIHGGSENPYAPVSESSSDYSAPATHRVMIIRDGEIYHPSSESGSSSNDYTSLKGQRSSIRRNDGIYYPASEGSNKDYATLAEDGSANIMGACGVDLTRSKYENDRDLKQSNARFNLSGFGIPTQGSNRDSFGIKSDLESVNQYETVASRNNKEQRIVAVGSDDTIADLCNRVSRTQSGVQPHEYFTLEPLDKTKP